MKRATAKRREERALVNEAIVATPVRLIAADGSQFGIVSREDALDEARKNELDLVLIAPLADPVVCKIMDYGKHVFEQKKEKSAQRKKQKQIQVKEMKFRPGTEKADYDVKLRKLQSFLENGDKAKVSLRFRGREMFHQELGMNLLKRIEGDLVDLAVVEMVPKMEGRQLTMVMAPKGKKKN